MKRLDKDQVELSRDYFVNFIKRSTDLHPELKSKIEKEINMSYAVESLDGFGETCAIC